MSEVALGRALFHEIFLVKLWCLKRIYKYRKTLSH